MTDGIRIPVKPEQLLESFPTHAFPEHLLRDVDSFAVLLRHPINNALIRLPIEMRVGLEVDNREVRFVVRLPEKLRELIHMIEVAPERKR